jgi:hypothetical protein
MGPLRHRLLEAANPDGERRKTGAMVSRGQRINERQPLYAPEDPDDYECRRS